MIAWFNYDYLFNLLFVNVGFFVAPVAVMVRLVYLGLLGLGLAGPAEPFERPERDY